MRMFVWNIVIWIWEIRRLSRRLFWEARLLQIFVLLWLVMILWKSQHQSWHVLLQRVQEIILFQQEIIRASFMLFHRLRSSSSSFLWPLELTVISRSLRASVMRMQEQTVLRVSFISLIWRWHLLIRKTYLRSLRMSFRQSLQSMVFTMRHQSRRLRESHILRQWTSMVLISRIFVSVWSSRMLQKCLQNVASVHLQEIR